MLSFFLTLFQALRVQMGVAFTEQIIQTFLNMFTRWPSQLLLTLRAISICFWICRRTDCCQAYLTWLNLRGVPQRSAGGEHLTGGQLWLQSGSEVSQDSAGKWNKSHFAFRFLCLLSMSFTVYLCIIVSGGGSRTRPDLQTSVTQHPQPLFGSGLPNSVRGMRHE